MIVVSNTSPITNLHAVGEIRLLRLLYERVCIPQAVYEELIEGVQRGDHPPLEAEWEWIEVRPLASSPLLSALLLQLDRGEAESIALARELSAGLLLMDERKGRKIAVQYGLTVTGVLGVLLDAKTAGYIPAVSPLMDRLKREARFWIGAELSMEILRLAEEENL